MTIRDYISQRLVSFGATDADFAMIEAAMPIDTAAEYSSDNDEATHIALITALEPMLLAPRRTNISENGFSVSWDFKGVGNWYMWLCRKYGVTPSPEVLDVCDISRISDKTHIW